MVRHLFSSNLQSKSSTFIPCKKKPPKYLARLNKYLGGSSINAPSSHYLPQYETPLLLASNSNSFPV